MKQIILTLLLLPNLSWALNTKHFTEASIDNKISQSTVQNLIEEKYRGEHGCSLKLSGLSPTNSKARQRGIVMHTADYVSDKWVAEQGRIGRS